MGTHGQRDLCKRIFFAFCYGMSTENIVKSLSPADLNLSDRVSLRDRILSFFDAYPGVITFRRKVEEQLERHGEVRSAFGNRRVRTSTGALSPKERRWAASQVIQGTASLIFKEALMAIAAKFGPRAIVLPMHDAALLQFDTSSIGRGEFVAGAKAAMVAAFEGRCPDVKARIADSAFGHAKGLQ